MTPKPVPVLLMARELGPGGSERQLAEILKGLDRNEFAPHAGFFRTGMRSDELERAGIPCLQIGITSFKNFAFAGHARSLGTFLRQNRIEVVHTFDYPLTCFAVPVARAFGVPVVLSSQRSHRALIPERYLKLVRLTDVAVDGIVVNCRALENYLASEEDIPRSKIHLCYNGIDFARSESVDKNSSSRLPGLPVTVGTVAVLRREKNLISLLRAVAQLRHVQPELAVLIVGSGPEERRLRHCAQQLGIAKNCVFEPSQKDVVPWLKRIDIFVLPSSTEALSNSLMEAMACGCAVIASNVGGNPELVVDGKTGLLFDPEKIPDLAAKITLLAGNELLRDSLSRNARRFIRERFSLEASVRCMSDLYRRLRAQRREGPE
jgi:glycosyltransferase involved in cell wall biosynthesis